MKKFCEIAESKYALILSGLCLLASLILNITEASFVFDPAIITVVISGLPLLLHAIRKLIYNKGLSRISSALLISIAMAASLYIGELFAAGEVAFIMAIGELLEEVTTSKAKRGLKNLIDITPSTARKIADGKQADVPVDSLSENDIIRILPGEKVPADCKIISGETSVDQSVLTGESLPVDKCVGDDILCGTVNCFGAVDAVVTKTSKNSSLQKLIELIRSAEKKKAPTQRSADKWASILVPVALFIAVCAYFIPPFDIERAVTVLVVFCPCALVLATPTAIMAAIGQATKHGVIIKSGEALENMGATDVIAFDKTGTLTYGTPQVSDVISFTDKKDFLKITAAAERLSTHPLARSIVKYCEEMSVDSGDSAVEGFVVSSGKGVTATVFGRSVLCGNEKFLKENGVHISNEAHRTVEKLSAEGKASVLTASDGVLLGLIGLSDLPRKEAKIIVNELKKENVSMVLLTGDNAVAAEFLADQVGISSIRAELLPHEKVEELEKLKATGKTVCMIGDGVNDAPALKTAAVGIAMGGIGSDIAAESSDIVLMADDISKLPYLKRLSCATLKTIRFGIFLSLSINIAAIILSLFKVLDPVTGALVHNGGSFLVILIAARLYDRKFI